jgi:C_GCAxxG_C_C family probable redox protein
MPETADQAVARMQEGYSCSQAVFASFAPRFGFHEDLALKMTAPFGGGIARHGYVCGAVTGALLILGLRFGSNLPKENQTAYEITNEFIRRFEARHGEILCRKLIGFDISTPEGSQTAKESGTFQTLCPELVRSAAGITAELLEQGIDPSETL